MRCFLKIHGQHSPLCQGVHTFTELLGPVTGAVVKKYSALSPEASTCMHNSHVAEHHRLMRSAVTAIMLLRLAGSACTFDPYW